MEKPQKIGEDITAILEFLDQRGISIDRQIAALRGAAHALQEIMNTEYQIASYKTILQNALKE